MINDTTRYVTFETADWKFIRDWAAEQLSNARSSIEQPHTSHEDTVFARGRIAVLKELAKLPDTIKLVVPPKGK